LIYRFEPSDTLNPLPTIDDVLAAITVHQFALMYNGASLEMGRGQYKLARKLAEDLADSHPILSDDTPIYVPCKTRKGRGGWGKTRADRSFIKKELAQVSLLNPSA
jgi:hypothetical protein